MGSRILDDGYAPTLAKRFFLTQSPQSGAPAVAEPRERLPYPESKNLMYQARNHYALYK